MGGVQEASKKVENNKNIDKSFFLFVALSNFTSFCINLKLSDKNVRSA
jgi:hypothetical protein